jgi:hypothetical protein
MRILFINSDGGGFVDHVEVADGTTVGILFDQKLADRDASDYLIRVNPSAAKRSSPGNRQADFGLSSDA